MSWLFAPLLRRFVLFACATSLLLNLALLVPAIYMTQVFDRVFASRSVETLVMLSVFAALALALGYAMDAVRARTLAFAGSALERRLAPAALAELLRQAAGASARGSADADLLRDVSQLRAFLGGHAIQALLDAPWLPVHLLVITLMHPLLGVIATLGAALLLALGVVTERLTRVSGEDVLRRSRGTQRRAEALARNADAIAGMGMGRAAVALWRLGHEALIDAQWRLAIRSSRLGALARMLRQALQVLLLAVGAWLVIDAGASPGIMVAATILLGRALQPVEFPICAHHRPVRLSWARLLKRVFDLDLEHCPNCGGELKIIAAILEQPVIEKILMPLGLQARAPPRAPARGSQLHAA
jgi:ABC-type protease/lipase transport system fused ATPase/permease subunit